MIALIGDKDSTTRRLLEDILADEQEHADELKDWLAEVSHRDIALAGGAHHHPAQADSTSTPKEITMNIRTTLAAIAAAIVLITASGCAVTRGQETRRRLRRRHRHHHLGEGTLRRQHQRSTPRPSASRR